MKFWDLEDHVFQFKTAELCPTIEEFSTILGYDPNKKFVVVSYDPRHKESLSDALGFPTSITSSTVEGHMVNLCAIISRLVNKCTYGGIDNMQKNLACLYALWHGFTDARAMSVVIRAYKNAHFSIGIVCK